MKSVFTLVLISIIVALAVFMGACSETTDPVVKPEEVSFQYTPVGATVDLLHGQDVDFSVAWSPSVEVDNHWKLNGEIVNVGTNYKYEGAEIGIDTLRIDSVYSSVNWDRIWYLVVGENIETIPPVVSSFVLGHGAEAADVTVSWNMITQSTFPVIEYQIAVSYDGPITQENWDAATILGAYPHLYNHIGFSVVFTENENGMLPGETAWFAIRGVDEVGQMSSLFGEFPHVISSPWYIDGFVYGDNGEALPNVIINYGCSSCRVNTDSQGHFSIGPVPNVNIYNLETLTDDYPGDGINYDSYYDFVATDVEYVPDGNYDIMLLARYGLDASCNSYDHSFMRYFRIMTNTDFPTDLRPNYNLYKWEDYPVPVYVPPFESEFGHDYQSLCREAVEFWNIAMDDEYMVLVDTPEEAKIKLEFGNDDAPYAGRTYLTLPNEQTYRLGDVVPEEVFVYVRDDFSQAIFIQEVTMHELGHAMGLLDHTLCSGEGFIMGNFTTGILANGPENAIHTDEKRAIQAIRNLPQATDISAFDFSEY